MPKELEKDTMVAALEANSHHIAVETQEVYESLPEIRETVEKRARNTRLCNPTTPDELAEIAKKTAQEVNSAVYGRRHQELAERYEQEQQSATRSHAKKEMANKLKSLREEKHIRKDGSEVMVVGNVKTRTETARDYTKIKYADDSFGWNQGDKRAVIDTIRSKPEFRNAKVKIIDRENKPIDHRQNAICHAEMQFLAHCKQANINHKDYVGGISKPACVKCDNALLSNIRALGDGIAKDYNGADIPSPSDARDDYSGRKLSRYAVKPEDWIDPDSMTPLHEFVNDKKTFTHNVTKSKHYGFRPEVSKPNIRKNTLQDPMGTLKRQTPKTVHKQAKKRITAQLSPGGIAETIIKHYDRKPSAEAGTLIHINPIPIRRAAPPAQQLLCIQRVHKRSLGSRTYVLRDQTYLVAHTQDPRA